MLDLSLDAHAVRSARPKSPVRASWRSFIEARCVASSAASSGVGDVNVFQLVCCSDGW